MRNTLVELRDFLTLTFAVIMPDLARVLTDDEINGLLALAITCGINKEMSPQETIVGMAMAMQEDSETLVKTMNLVRKTIADYNQARA